MGSQPAFLMAGVMNKSQISISLSSFLLILSKTHLFVEELGAHLAGWFMAVSICPTFEVVNNSMAFAYRFRSGLKGYPF